MIIYWFGQSCLKIEGEKSTLVTEPFNQDTGLKVPRLAADIVIASQDNQNAKSVKGTSAPEPFLINEAGEYEIKNTFIYGVELADDHPDKTKTIIYRLEIDGFTLAYLGELKKPLDNGQVEKLEGVDILLIPVGGGDNINAKQAAEIISQLEPRIVIPINYKIKGLKTNLDSLDKFCKEIGVCPTEALNKFKLAKKDLPQEEMKVIVLQP